MPKVVQAKASFVRMSPRKLRLIARSVKNQSPQTALVKLKLLPHRAARIWQKVVSQAVGNAKNNFGLSPAELVITSVRVDEGPRYKRRDVHAHGARFDSGIRRKKTAHLTVELSTKTTHGTQS